MTERNWWGGEALWQGGMDQTVAADKKIMANLGVTQQSSTALIAGGCLCFLPIQIIIHSNIFECPRNGLNDKTQHMLLHNWNATTCHNYYSTTIMNHDHPAQP